MSFAYSGENNNIWLNHEHLFFHVMCDKCRNELPVFYFYCGSCHLTAYTCFHDS